MCSIFITFVVGKLLGTLKESSGFKKGIYTTNEGVAVLLHPLHQRQTNYECKKQLSLAA